MTICRSRQPFYLLCQLAACLLTASQANAATSFTSRQELRLINGTPVPSGTYQEVVRITTGGAGCTATVVGKRVIVTAAHCANNGATSIFKIGGVSYSAKIKRSPLYQNKDHDLAMGITSEDIAVAPAIIGSKAYVGAGITLLGYGCTNTGGTGGNDGVLRVGDSVVTEFNNFDMVSRKANGAALCFGDSGGPAFITDRGKQKLLGINSKGNIADTNWNTRLDRTESIDFLKTQAQENGVTICGINSDCASDPLPTAPTCTLGVNPSKLKLGESVTLTLIIQGQATSASIDGTPIDLTNPQHHVTATSKGLITARGIVTNAAGSGFCETTYLVEDAIISPDPPTCSITAIPSLLKVGETVTLEITAKGQVDKVDIDGTPTSYPFGKKLVTATAKGDFNVRGGVSGPGGSGSCWTYYKVEPGNTPPITPALAVIVTYCGENTLPTSVRTVCTAVIKKNASIPDLRINDGLVITYQDASQEILPVINRRRKNSTMQSKRTGKVQEELTVYTGGLVAAGSGSTTLVLDSRQVQLTSNLTRRESEVPIYLEGRSSKGHYFIVDEIRPFAPR